MHVCMRTYMCVYMHVHILMDICVYVCMCRYMCVWMWVLSANECINLVPHVHHHSYIVVLTVML